jgi:hypothetical protein
VSVRYITEFLDMKCAPDLLAMKLFPRSNSAKEVSEAMGAYAAVRKHLRAAFPFGDESVRVVCVGDGNTPRAAATFAFRSRWEAHSIDPRLKSLKHRGHRPCRLTLHPKRVEECRFDWENPTIIVACHSHAPLEAAVAAVPNACRLAVVAIPCCVPQTIPGLAPDHDYADSGIISEKRRILVWKEIRNAS